MIQFLEQQDYEKAAQLAANYNLLNRSGAGRVFYITENSETLGAGALTLDENGVSLSLRAAARDDGQDLKDFLLRSLLNVCRGFKDTGFLSNAVIFISAPSAQYCGKEVLQKFGFTPHANGGFTAMPAQIRLGGCCGGQ
ncbi:MAG: hypothetical protein FWH03_08410 [Firmicutes bacterium]|nr:hypothetical protein [Bacillota bacterium]